MDQQPSPEATGRTPDHIVYFDDLVKDYGKLRAVDGLTFGVPRGSLFGFLGANGAGKSTTLKILMGLIAPTRGRIFLFGQESAGVTSLRARIGALIEYPAFYDHLSGRANLEIYSRLCGAVDRKQIDELLAAVGLTHAARRKVSGYSQGMRQRLGVAQSLLGNPELLVLDEPTNGLDPEGSREIWLLLRRQVAEKGITILISSHLLNEVEEGCDRVAIIDKGKLVRCDQVAHLLRDGAARVSVEFIDADTATRAADLIARWPEVELEPDALAEAGGARLICRLTTLTAEQFNRRLYAEQLPFNFVQPADRTLKDYFLAMRDKHRAG